MESFDRISALRPLRKRGWWLLASMLLAAIAVFSYLWMQPLYYESHATVMLGNPYVTPSALQKKFADIYAEIAKRSNAATAAQQALRLDYMPNYEIKAVPNSQVLMLRVVDANPATAQAMANELIQQLNKQVEPIDLQNGQTTSIDPLNRLYLLEPATLATTPLAKQWSLKVALAALLGFGLAVLGAYLLAYLDQSIQDTQQIQREFGLSTLGVIPEVDPENQNESKLVMLSGESPSASEAFRMLRTNLQSSPGEQPLRLMLITSPQPSEGKSFSAANLSVAWARAGKRVILVDADLHRPSQHRIFRQLNRVGLTNALLGDYHVIESLLQPGPVHGLRILTSGPLPPNPSELLSTKRMQEILQELRNLADIVILDTPPVTLVADPAQLATQVDGVLLVFHAKRTTRQAAAHAIAALQQIHAHILGVLFNSVSRGNAGYHYDPRTAYRQGHTVYRGDPLYQAHREAYQNGLEDEASLRNPILSS